MSENDENIDALASVDEEIPVKKDAQFKEIETKDLDNMTYEETIKVYEKKLDEETEEHW